MFRGAVVLLAIALALCFEGTAGQGLRWRQVHTAEAGPVARQGHILVFDHDSNQLVLFGGTDENGTQLNDVWLFDIEDENVTWTAPVITSKDAPDGRSYAFSGLVRVNDQSLLVIASGFADGVEFGDLWTFNLDTSAWLQLQVEGGVGTRYAGHSGYAFEGGNVVWMGGGFTFTTGLATRYIDTYILTFQATDQATFEEIYGQPTAGNQFQPLHPHGRCLQGSALVRQDELVIWGGCMKDGRGGGPCPAEDGWFFNNSADVQQWTKLPLCATPRVWSAMAPLSNDSGKAVLYGGSDIFGGQVISAVPWPESEVLVVDVDEQTWTRYNTTSEGGLFPARRWTHAMAPAREGRVYLFGGRLLSNNSLLNDLWVLSGDPEKTDTLSCDRVWFSYLHLHGLLMGIAFGILFPTGFLIARYYRCSGSKAWFIAHVTVQLVAVALTIPAFVMIWFVGASKQPTHPHAIIGLFIFLFMLMQPINGFLRPHIKKGEEKSLYRKIWEIFHRSWGLCVITLGLLEVSLGVFLIVPPAAVWTLWIIILLGWIIAFSVHETIKCFRTCCLHSDDYRTASWFITFAAHEATKCFRTYCLHSDEGHEDREIELNNRP